MTPPSREPGATPAPRRRYSGSRPYTQRVEVGAYYTDGHYLAEVTEVNPLGYVHMLDSRAGAAIGCGISAFRRRWWLVRDAA